VDKKTEKKKHRYFVLTPTYVSIFDTEQDAFISEAGFMQGQAVLPQPGQSAEELANKGVMIPLAELSEARPDPDAKKLTFAWHLKSPQWLAHADVPPMVLAEEGSGEVDPAGASEGGGGSGEAAEPSAPTPKPAEEDAAAAAKAAAKEAKRAAKRAQEGEVGAGAAAAGGGAARQR
jgi:hypothetical protein